MPPPPVPQGRHSRQPTPDWTPNPPSNGLPPVLAPLGLPEKPTKIIPGKQAGFKPIVQSSSALKMFFPGDEDEAEFASGSGRSHHSHSDSNVMENDLERQEPPDIISGSTVESGSTASWNKPTRESDGGWGGRLAQSKGFSQARGPRRPSQNGQQQYLPDPHAASRHPSWDHSVYPPASANEFVSVPSIVSTSVNGFVTAPAMGGFDASAPSSYPGPPIAREFEEPYHQSQPAFAPQSQVPIPPPTRRSPPQETPISQLSVSKPPSAPWTVPEPAMTSSKSDEPVASDRKELYAILNQVGEGTFGKVYKARNTVSNVFVALKRIRMESERDGFPVTAMREIKLLQSLKHANVVRLYEMMVSNSSVYMVFEYMDHDLTGILSQTQFKFSEAHLKSLCHQMLAGLAYLHHKGVIHRDIKGSNILLNNRGELKLADFGLARFYQKRRRMDYTNRVITLWYRPPELLFGATVYGAEVDMWSAGCIMLELFTKKPIFQGNDEIHQLHVIFKILGTPTSERWKALPNLPWYELIKPKEALPNRFRDYFHKWLSPAALDLAERLLTYDPDLRVTAQEAMEAPYFTQETPFAERPTGLSTLDGEWHELETKQERHRKRKKTENVPA
ncbi:Pkinase-domain-containing protein [Coprinopsis marcescibilis]|uniref:Pkinase-domain-containing protein n=1 Tax=Coprinopsis marcescibilis TaxID=230819 RepID=A0A5C3KSP4_COPMA|nr:Pkinase-domain-containing protein [Coprinopsis marcescibilis]